MNTTLSAHQILGHRIADEHHQASMDSLAAQTPAGDRSDERHSRPKNHRRKSRWTRTSRPPPDLHGVGAVSRGPAAGDGPAWSGTRAGARLGLRALDAHEAAADGGNRGTMGLRRRPWRRGAGMAPERGGPYPMRKKPRGPDLGSLVRRQHSAQRTRPAVGHRTSITCRHGHRHEQTSDAGASLGGR